MQKSLALNLDYVGIYVLPSRGKDKEFEILMADSMRFKDEATGAITFCKMLFCKNNDELLISIEGQFQERPIEMTTRHVRADIYINTEHKARIIRWIRKNFKPSSNVTFTKGPDPSKFVRGQTFIPLAGKPSCVVNLGSALFITPNWTIRTKNSRAFVDVERDVKFGRIQIHLGIRCNYSSLNNSFSRKIGQNYSVSGKIEFSKVATEELYSYIVQHA